MKISISNSSQFDRSKTSGFERQKSTSTIQPEQPQQQKATPLDLSAINQVVESAKKAFRLEVDRILEQ